MKQISNFILISLLFGCTSEPKTLEQISITVISDSKIEIGSQIYNLPAALDKLGSPEGKRINISACQNLKTAALQKVTSELKSAGFEHLGFKSESFNTPSCALTNRSRGTAE